MYRLIRYPIVAAVAAFLLAPLAQPVDAAEEGTVRALSAWHSDGVIYRVGENEALFVGEFFGVMYFETAEGTLDAAQLICPGQIEIDLDDGEQAGSGRCILTSQAGDQVFARWTCAGMRGKGCTGEFILNGGTGRLRGISGGGDMVVRSAFGNIEIGVPLGEVEHTGAGLAVWPALQYKIPDAE